MFVNPITCQTFEHANLKLCENNFQNGIALDPDTNQYYVLTPESIIITTPNREVLTATDLLQCGVDSSHRLQYMGFQEMRKVEWNTFLDSCTNTVCNLRRIAETKFSLFS